MSDKNDIPTNEEVIDEITQEFKDQHITNKEPVDLQKDETESCIPESFDKSDDEEESSKSDNTLNDFIDEEELKKVNDNLTEEEKEDRKKEAADLKNQGNTEHKSGKYLEAIDNYTKALRLCPLENQTERSVLYSNRAASKIQLNYKKPAVNDCCRALELNPSYVRAYLRRAKLYEDLDNLDKSLADYEKVLEFDLGNHEAKAAIIKLKPLINERNEKLKTEMLG